jgi:hypothetical protein
VLCMGWLSNMYGVPRSVLAKKPSSLTNAAAAKVSAE